MSRIVQRAISATNKGSDEKIFYRKEVAHFKVYKQMSLGVLAWEVLIAFNDDE